MTSLPDLQTISDALSQATGPDRALDLAIATTMFPRGNCFAPEGDCLDWLDLHEPEFTASIDAALALVGRRLPGWCYKLDQERPYPDFVPVYRCILVLLTDDNDTLEELVSALASPTPAIAVLRAWIAAEITKESQPSDTNVTYPHDHVLWLDGTKGDYSRVPKYRLSYDAIAELVERVLPGWAITTHTLAPEGPYSVRSACPGGPLAGCHTYVQVPGSGSFHGHWLCRERPSRNRFYLDHGYDREGADGLICTVGV